MRALFGVRRPEGLRLSWRELRYLVLYTLAIAAASVLVHEAAHIVTALAFGVPFNELRLGFLGINPCVSLPEWFNGTPRTIVYYAGGLTAGVGMSLFYFLYWLRRYRRDPSPFCWSLGSVTIVLVGMQLATGYLEGRYHGAYIAGATSLFSPTDVLIYGWAASALFFHTALCPWQRMKMPVKPIKNTH